MRRQRRSWRAGPYTRPLFSSILSHLSTDSTQRIPRIVLTFEPESGGVCAPAGGRLRADRGRDHRGRAVQVDPMNPTVKALGYKRLKLENDNLLSNFAFNFN
jgi:hypothetical protein